MMSAMKLQPHNLCGYTYSTVDNAQKIIGCANYVGFCAALYGGGVIAGGGLA